MILTPHLHIDCIIIAMVLFYVLMIANKQRTLMDKKPFLGIDGMMILCTIIVITSTALVMYNYDDIPITQSSHNHDHHNAHWSVIGGKIRHTQSSH